MKVRIVTDSSSDIPPEMARELDITVVPLSVRFGSQTYRDGIDIMPEEFYRRLVDEPVHPATSAASPRNPEAQTRSRHPARRINRDSLDGLRHRASFFC